MTQQPNSFVRSSLRQSKIFFKRLAYLGSLGVFSSGVAIAQTPAPTVSPSPVSQSTDVTVPIASSPAPTAIASPQPASTATPEPVAPKPATPVIIESPAPKAEASPKPQAPSAYQAPSSIVITDRKSGCEFAMAQGQAVSGRCGNVTATTPQNTGIGNTISKAISSVIRPKFATPTPDAPVDAIASSSSNASWTPPSIVPPSFVQDYYNRTIRPLGLPGNGDVRLLFPLSIPAAISSIFGWRVHPISGSQSLHTGTDLAAPMGTPVLAALTGRVIMADFFGGYGLAIALEHTNGTQQTLYGHLSEIFVKPGDVIKQGTVIGRVGSTGNSTGPHLHFEFRQQTQDGTWVAQDPGSALEQSMAQLVKSMQVTQQAPENSGQPRS